MANKFSSYGVKWEIIEPRFLEELEKEGKELLFSIERDTTSFSGIQERAL